MWPVPRTRTRSVPLFKLKSLDDAIMVLLLSPKTLSQSCVLDDVVQGLPDTP